MKKLIVIKKEHKLYIQTGKQHVAGVLYRYPDKEFSLSELANESGVAKANIGKILDEFHKSKFIEIVKLSKIWRIKANQNEGIFIKNKITYNLGCIYNSGLVEYLNDYFKNPKAIVLFGSFRRGEDVSSSDIDIAIEVERGGYEIFELKELHGFEKNIGRKIQIHTFNRKSVDVNVFSNIANGIVLSGFLEVRP